MDRVELEAKQAVADQKGVTLIEVAIAIAVLGIVAAGILGYFAWSFGVFNYTNVRATEESLARSQMEKIKSDNWNNAGIYTLIPSIPSGYAVSGNVTGTPLLFGANVSGTSGLQLITVVVKRTYNPQPGTTSTENVTLQGYKGSR